MSEAIRVTRIYTGPDGESHFEDRSYPLYDEGPIGWLSETILATGVVFRETDAAYDFDWHCAPQRQFVIMLAGGGVEIEVGSGERRRLYAGDVLLAEDVTGRGHRSRAISDEPRISILVRLDETADQ